MRTVKTLIRLGGCPGWSESSLGAHASLLVLSRGGLYVLKVWWDGLCTEGGEEQPSPIKLGCPDSSVSKMVCYIAATRVWVALAMNIHWYVWIDDGFRVRGGFTEYFRVTWPRPTLVFLQLKTGRAAPCNTRSVKCYAPVICNHVSYRPEE